MRTINIVKIKALLSASSFLTNTRYFNSEFKSITNPFHLKSLHELQKMLQSTLSQKSSGNIYGLLLIAITDKVMVKGRKIPEKGRHLDDNAIVNKCLELTFSHIQETDINGLLYISNVFQRLQDSKNIHLQENNYRAFIDEFPNRLTELLNDSTARQSMKELCQILFNLIRIRRKGNVLNKLIHFISDNGLDNKAQILQFLKQLMKYNQNRTEFKNIEKVIKRYIDCLDFSTQSTASIQDYNPVILETIQNSGILFKPIYCSLVKDYIPWLEKQLRKNSLTISVWTKIKMIQEIIAYFYYLPGHILERQNMRKHYQFIQWLYQNIHEDLKQCQKLDLMEVQNLIKAIFSYQNMNNYDLWSMEKVPIDFKANAVAISNTLALKFIETFDQYKDDEIISLINDIGFSGLRFDQQVSNKLVEVSINFLQGLNFKKLLLPTIRIFQFITFNILESKSEKYLPQMKALLSRIEKNVKNLTYYQLLRLHAIIMNLNIQALQIRQFFQFKNLNNQEQTVENLCRTILKKYSLPQIKQICENTIEKYQKNKNFSQHNFKKCDIISVSLRGSKLDNDNENDEMFKFWFHAHWNFTKQVFKRIESVQYTIKYINKQLSKSYFFSIIKSQLQIQSFYIARSQIQDKNIKKDVEKKVEEFLKPYLKLQKFNNSETQKRYSFFPKLAWLYRLHLENIDMPKDEYKLQSIFKQLLLFSREDKSLDTSSFHCLRKALIFDIIQKKLEHSCENFIHFILQIWFWANRNDLLEELSFFKQNQHILYNHCINVNKKTGSIYDYLEFYLGNSFQEKNLVISNDGVNPKWIWYPFLKGQSNQNVKTEDIMNLLSYRNIIKYFCQKNENFIEFLISRMIEADYCVGYLKFLQAWKIVNKFESKVSIQLRQKVDFWFENQLSMMKQMNPVRYPQLFIKTQQYKKLLILPKQIEKYLSQNLKMGNFYQINQYVELAEFCKVQDVEALLNSLYINRSLLYLTEFFPIICFDVINNLFSLVLFKNDRDLIRKFTTNFLEFIQKINMKSISSERKYEFLMKLKIASSVIDEETLWKSHHKISKDLEITDEKISNHIHEKQLQIILKEGLEHFLKTFMYQPTKVFNLSLLMNKKKYVLLADKVCQFSKIESMYLQKYHHLTEIQSLGCQEYARLYSLEKAF